MRRHKKQCTIGSHFDVEILLKSRLSLLKSFPVSVRRSSWTGLESCLDSNFSCCIFFWVIEEESLLLHFVLLSLSINSEQNICTRWSTTHFGESQSFNWLENYYSDQLCCASHFIVICSRYSGPCTVLDGLKIAQRNFHAKCSTSLRKVNLFLLLQLQWWGRCQ